MTPLKALAPAELDSSMHRDPLIFHPGAESVIATRPLPRRRIADLSLYASRGEPAPWRRPNQDSSAKS